MRMRVVNSARASFFSQSEAEVLQLASLPNGPSGVEPPSASLTNMPFSPATALLDDDDEEVNARRALWKETWREILPVSHANATTASAVDTTTAGIQQSHLCPPGGYSATGVCPLADLLKPPLLTTFISTLSEALIRSPSWFVRNQAALALLSVSAAIVSQSMFLLTTVASSMMRDAMGQDRSNAVVAAADAASASASALQISKTQTAGLGVQQSSASEVQQENDNEEEDEEEAEEEEVGDDEEDEDEEDEDEEEEEEDEDDEEDEQDEEENEAVFLIWCELARVLTAALKETGSWSGKVYLLRTVRMLTQTALERVFNLDDPNNELINEMWSVLVRETRTGRSEHAGPSYQAEAFWALASFAEICGRDATGLMEVKEKDDRLTRLLRLILPNGIPDANEQQASSKKGKQTQFQISQELSEAEQELAVKTVGVMWPLQTKQPHVDRFVDTMHHLVFLMSQGGWRIQSAALGSILAMFAKLRTEQGEELVKKASEGGGNPLEKLGLKELMNRLKRCAENTKSSVLREHALGAIASMLRHRSFVALIHSQLEELVQSYVNCGTSTMRDWACALMKSL